MSAAVPVHLRSAAAAPARRGLVLALSAGLIALMTVISLFDLFVVTPWFTMIGALAIAAALLRRFRTWARDWFPFFAAYFLFDGFRAIAYLIVCRLQRPVFATYVIDLERALFGRVLAPAFQAALNPAGSELWRQVVSINYTSYFLGMMVLGIWVYVRRPDAFTAFKRAFYVMTPVGLLGYVLLPTVPPWMASRVFGILPPIAHVSRAFMDTYVSGMTKTLSTNPIGAMPSLHVALPALSAFILVGLAGFRRSWPLTAHAALMVLTVIYTGDHYGVDAVVGVALAGAVFAAVFLPTLRRSASRPADGPALMDDPVRPAFAPSFAAGLAVFAAAAAISVLVRADFRVHPETFDAGRTPRYVDFLDHPGRYADNFGVQLYLARHLATTGDARGSSAHLRMAESLAANEAELRAVAAAGGTVNASGGGEPLNGDTAGVGHAPAPKVPPGLPVRPPARSARLK